MTLSNNFFSFILMKITAIIRAHIWICNIWKTLHLETTFPGNWKCKHSISRKKGEYLQCALVHQHRLTLNVLTLILPHHYNNRPLKILIKQYAFMTNSIDIQLVHNRICARLSTIINGKAVKGLNMANQL